MVVCEECKPCEAQRPPIGLEDFRRVLRYNPYYFWQMAQEEKAHPDTPIPRYGDGACEHVVYESGGTAGLAGGREDVWRAIVELSRRWVAYAGFFAAPTYACFEQHFYDAYDWLDGLGAQRWAGQSGKGQMVAPHKYVQAVGVERLEKLATVAVDVEADVADENGDGLPDTVTVQIGDQNVTAQAELSELLAFRVGGSGDDVDFWQREIRPACFARLADGRVQLTFRSWLGVAPALYGGFAPAVLDPADRSIYIDEVEIWRRWHDAGGGVLVKRRGGCSCGSSCGCGVCYACEVGAACVIDGQKGLLQVDKAAAERGGQSCGQGCVDGSTKLTTSGVVVHYLSGDCGNETLFARGVAGLLNCFLCCDGTACCELNHWQTDMVGMAANGTMATQLSDEELVNPFGTTRGGVAVYHALRSRRRMRGLRV